MVHHVDKRAARALLGSALAALGWHLYGWKENRSDSMTDYYDPESWRGVATKDGATVCVGISDYDVGYQSGKEETKVHHDVRGPDCERCDGSGVDPLGWTLTEARANPHKYHKECDAYRAEGLPGNAEVVPLSRFMPGPPPVSPIPFDKHDGRLSCMKCHGRGATFTSRTEHVCTWPTFQANPGRSVWHVERDGKIIAKGTGVYTIATKGGNHAVQTARAQELAQKIDDALKVRKTPATKTAPETVGGNRVQRRKIDAEVRAILEASTVEGSFLRLPYQHLARPLYVKVAAVLGELGGKWNRKARGFVFDGPPRAKLNAALESGDVVREKQTMGAFYTPPHVAETVARVADVEGRTVLEPSAGEGALAQACHDAGAEFIQAVEIDRARLAKVEQITSFTICADFLSLLLPEDGARFERVVMNPPFAGGAAVRHVERALQWLAPGGRLVAIVPANRGRFRSLLSDVDALGCSWDWGSLPDGSFKESGTNVRVALLVIDKPAEAPQPGPVPHQTAAMLREPGESGDDVERKNAAGAYAPVNSVTPAPPVSDRDYLLGLLARAAPHVDPGPMGFGSEAYEVFQEIERVLKGTGGGE